MTTTERITEESSGISSGISSGKTEEQIIALRSTNEKLTIPELADTLGISTRAAEKQIARVNRVFGDKKGGLVVDYIGIAQDLKNALANYMASKGRGEIAYDLEEAVAKMQELYEIVADMFDVFDAAGIKKPDISILSDEFLAEIQGMKRQNLALELLKRLLNDEVKTRGKTNLVQGRKFSDMLADAVKRYQSGLIDSARMIDELIRLAKDIREADKRGEKMNLQPDELAFYDALADNPPDDPATGEYTVSVTKVLDQAEALADFWSIDEK